MKLLNIKSMINLPRIEPQLPVCDLAKCKIALVGEAPGRDEVPAGIPFVGRAGQLLDSMLVVSGIDRTLCYVTNVFLCRPPDNKVAYFFSSRMAAKLQEKKVCEELPPFNNAYLKEEFLPELIRLSDEISNLKPKVVITLGATAMWAFTGAKGIMAERGSIYDSHLVPGMNVVPTYHPAYILRNMAEKETMIEDLELAKSLAEG